MEGARRPHDIERRLAAENVIVAQNAAYARPLYLLILERRRREMRGDGAGIERIHGFRMRHRHGQRVELAEIRLPHSVAAAICRSRACVEILIAVTAILSFSVKSRIVFTAGLLVTSSTGMSLSAATPRTSFGVLRVLAQSVTRLGTPPEAKSSPPESSASFMALGLPSLAHETLTGRMPARSASFSTSLPSSIIIRAR